jgi:hypothetical protein
VKDDDLKKLVKTVDRIYESEEYQNRRERMSRYRKYYCGYYWPKGDEEDAKESGIFVNLIFSTVAAIAPMLTDNKPIWSIRSEYPFLQPIANVYKAAGESVWEIEDMDTKHFLVWLDALICGYGVMQVSFDPQRSFKGEVSLEVVDPMTYFQAPGFTDNWDAPLSGTVTERSLWWVRSNYPDTGKNVKPEGEDKKTFGERVSGMFKGKMDHEYMGTVVKVYTTWMRDDSVMEIEENGEKKKKPRYPNGRFSVFTKDVVLEDKEYPYNHGKPPWVILCDYHIPHSFAGMGEAQQIEGMVLEYNLAMRKMAKQIRLYAEPPWILDAGSGIEDEKWKEGLLAKGPRVYMKNTGTDAPEQAKVNPLEQSVYAFVNGLPTQIEEVSGVTATSKGMASKKQRQSAHEISALLETSYTRTRQRVRNGEAFIKRLFSLTVEIMQQFYDEPRNFSLRNGNNENEWYKINNKSQFASGLMKPEKEFIEKPNSEDDEEYQDLKQQWEDYAALLEHIGDEKSVYFKFRIDIDTNSMLPMDKQSLANLGLQLGQQGRIDTLTLLQMLHIPYPEKIVARLKEEAAARQPQEGPPPGMEGAQNG